MSRNKRLVPNDFTVQLSQHDHDKLAPYARTLNAELATELRNHAREMGYVFNGPIKIGFELDSHLPTGRFTVTSQAVAGITPAEGAQKLPSAERHLCSRSMALGIRCSRQAW